MVIGIIRLYQLAISPFLGKNCRFSPSCSEYAIEAIRKHQFLLGIWLTIKRLLRCNPWNKQFGKDDVP
ncbi:MAG TPA: membrane protein insertion efficiency factor YidD [Parachlamydiaceae bacterium]|nr:membrane protein insertion efficiency factor YidD [Parachlamydiaceae bacterium]